MVKVSHPHENGAPWRACWGSRRWTATALGGVVGARLTDEAIVLPSASRSDESGASRMWCSLRADEPDLNPVFKCQLFTGLSAGHDAADAKRILSDRKGSAERLAAAIPSELADAESPSARPRRRCAGSRRQGVDMRPRRAVELRRFVLGGQPAAFLGAVGMSRVHDTYFGLQGRRRRCRLHLPGAAGGKSGKTLDQVFDADGPPAARSGGRRRPGRATAP